MNPKIHVLVLNWNGSQYLDQCLDSIRKNNYSNYDITVIDNNSSDDSLSKIKKFNIPIVSHSYNYKYAKGYNKAIFNFDNDDSDYYLLLNNDVICDSNLISSFVEGINNYGSNCIMGAKIFDANNRDKIWYAGGKFGFFNFFVSHYGIRKKNSIKYDKDYKTGYITGCCLLISKENFYNLKGFNENFNMYGEDVDLSIRAQNIGIDCYYIYKAELWHYISSSYGGSYSLSKNIQKFNSLFKLILKYPKKLLFNL